MAAFSERFEQHKLHIEQENAKADALKVESDRIKAQIQEKRLRIEQGLPSPESCTDCWVDAGIDSRFSPIPRRDSTPIKFDSWACHRCGYSFDRPYI
jgi:hypothetical protein